MSDNREINDLLSRFLEAGEELSDAEWGALLSAFGDNPELLSELSSQLEIDALLQLRPGYEKSLLAGIKKRLAAETDIPSKTAEKRFRVTSRRTVVSRKSHSFRNFIFSAAAALVLCAGLFAWLVNTRRSALQPQVTGLSGTAVLLRNSQKLAVSDSGRCRLGDEINTGENTRLSCRYPDGTLLHLAAETRLRFGHGRYLLGKRLNLPAGQLQVRASPQAHPFVISTPHATVSVVGTEFSLDVKPESTELEVTEGKVMLGDRQGASPVPVSAGQHFAASASGLSEIKPPEPASLPEWSTENGMQMQAFRNRDGTFKFNLSTGGKTLEDAKLVQFREVNGGEVFEINGRYRDDFTGYSGFMLVLQNGKSITFEQHFIIDNHTESAVDWRDFSKSFSLPPETRKIIFVYYLTGKGSIELDDFLIKEPVSKLRAATGSFEIGSKKKAE